MKTLTTLMLSFSCIIAFSQKIEVEVIETEGETLVMVEGYDVQSSNNPQTASIYRISLSEGILAVKTSTRIDGVTYDEFLIKKKMKLGNKDVYDLAHSDTPDKINFGMSVEANQVVLVGFFSNDVTSTTTNPIKRRYTQEIIQEKSPPTKATFRRENDGVHLMWNKENRNHITIWLEDSDDNNLLVHYVEKTKGGLSIHVEDDDLDSIFITDEGTCIFGTLYDEEYLIDEIIEELVSFFPTKTEYLKELEKKRQAEEMIKKFLAERNVTSYEYSEINQSGYRKVKLSLKDKLEEVCRLNNSIQYNVGFTLDLKIDTAGKVTRNIKFEIGQSDLKNEIEKSLSTVILPPVYKNGYAVNAKMNEKYRLTNSSQKMQIKTSSSGLKLTEGEPNKFQEHYSYLDGQLRSSDKPKGRYSIIFSESSFNDESNKSIQYLDFIGLGGASSSLLSVLVPGLGNHLVIGGKGSMLGQNVSPWITTIGVFALVGSGIGLELVSQKKYGLYHQATVQADIDKYYESANSKHKAGYALIGIGAGLWIADVIWTASKGTKNKKQERAIKEKLNIAFYPTATTDNLAMTMTIKIR